jgi:hypothetical protein
MRKNALTGGFTRKPRNKRQPARPEALPAVQELAQDIQ